MIVTKINKRTKKSTNCKIWIKELKYSGQIFKVDYLEYFDKDSVEVDYAEQFYIIYFKSLGINLLNHNNGGRDEWLYDKQLNEERLRLSKEGLNRPEVKAHLSELTKKQWADPEMRERMSKKVNINKEAQKKSKETCRKVRGSKFFDDLGNFYESVGDFADKWNTTINKVQYALYNNRPILGRTLKRAS